MNQSIKQNNGKDKPQRWLIGTCEECAKYGMVWGMAQTSDAFIGQKNLKIIQVTIDVKRSITQLVEWQTFNL